MIRRTIRLSLDPASIEAAIKEIEAERALFLQKANDVAYRLAELGLEVASVGFDTAFYQGYRDTDCEIEETDKGFRVVARGQTVCFIEFGAGVFYNPNSAYPANKPAGIVDIGEYGKGQGSHDGWYFIEGNTKVFTRGNAAAMPMYYASQEIRQAARQIVKEVFS